MDVKATLYVYPGINDLPSIDPSCCQLLLLLNYYGIENVRIEYYRYYPRLKVPCLECDGKRYYEIDQIAKILKSLSKHNLESLVPDEDQELKRKDVYKYYIKDCFHLPVYLQMYEDRANRQHTLSIMRKSYIFPFSMIFTRQMSEEIESTIDFYLKSHDSKVNINWETVSEGLANFSNYVQSKRSLSENTRTELDAYLVGCLAPVVLGKYGSGELIQQLARYRILTDYISEYIKLYSKHPNKDFQKETQKVTEETKDDVAPPSTIILATLFAGTAMILFGMFNGIIRLS